ncbi:MAG: hypothetical protein R3F43_24900 [bacterium]
MRHVALGREEVLRVLRDEIEQERLPQVLPIVAGLRSPHGVRVLDLVPPRVGVPSSSTTRCSSPRWPRAGRLDARPRGRSSSPTAAARIIHQVGRALQEAHHHGIAMAT